MIEEGIQGKRVTLKTNSLELDRIRSTCLIYQSILRTPDYDIALVRINYPVLDDESGACF